MLSAAGDRAWSPAALVPLIRYKPGWVFRVGGPGHRYLCVYATTHDSLDPTRQRCTQHMFEFPDGPVTDREFARWVLVSLMRAEFHEAAEFLAVDGFRPFYPHHQDEGSPYEWVERWPS
jgi:hypothetical protein